MAFTSKFLSSDYFYDKQISIKHFVLYSFIYFLLGYSQAPLFHVWGHELWIINQFHWQKLIESPALPAAAPDVIPLLWIIVCHHLSCSRGQKEWCMNEKNRERVLGWASCSIFFSFEWCDSWCGIIQQRVHHWFYRAVCKVFTKIYPSASPR